MLFYLILLLAIGLYTFIFLLNYGTKWRNSNKRLKHFNRPKGWPILGNALELRTFDRLIPTFHKYHQQFKGLFLVSMLLETHISISNYEFMEKVFNSTKLITKSREYIYLSKWLRTGLLTSTGEKWQKRRKLLTPAFHFNILEQVVDVFNSASEILVKKLEKEVNAPSFNVYPYITLCALDIISEASMGIKINAQLNEDNNYVKSVNEMGKIIVRRTTSPLKQYDFFYKFSADCRKERKALKILHGTTDKVIKQRRQELSLINTNVKNENDENEILGKKKRLAFLDLLLNASIDGEPLSDADIREEVDTFMFEGHDTTSSGISFALYNLAKYPDLQNKVFEEQLAIFNDDLNRALNYNDLQEMMYLEMFIKESLRLFPPVPAFARKVHEDTLINGVLFPKDAEFSIFVFSAMRNKDHFDEPEKFDPERFALENKSNIKPYAHIPFSAGPRNCIGQKMAMMELKAVLSKVVRNFKIKSVKGFEPILTFEVILKSANGIHIALEKRQI